MNMNAQIIPSFLKVDRVDKVDEVDEVDKDTKTSTNAACLEKTVNSLYPKKIPSSIVRAKG
jgi:hypothetical protein